MTMICGNCNTFGIHWVGPYGNLTGTKCDNCGGTNCQIDIQPEENDEPEDDPQDLDDPWAGDDMMGSSS